VSQKNIPDIFDCNFKKSYQILIISGVNIPDTTCHQITVQLFTSPNVCFCITKGMQTKQNMSWNTQKCEKNIPNIIDHNLKKHNQIFIIIFEVFLTPLATKWLFKFPPPSTSALALPGQNWPSKSCVKMNEKNLYKFYLSKSLAPTASQLQGLTVIKQCVYQMMFTNVYEFKKELVKSGLVWSRTLLILLSMNAESVSVPVFAQCAHISSNFAVGS